MNASLLSRTGRMFGGPKRPPCAAPGRRRRLRAAADRFEALESRALLSGYTLTLVDSFTTSNSPRDNLTLDASGNLWGVTADGGSADVGTVYKIAAGSNTITTIDSFKGGVDGRFPYGGLTLDSAGNLWGTTAYGGTDDNGTVYKIAAGSSTITIVASFVGDTLFISPEAGVTFDSAGNLWGTTYYGGTSDMGTVYEIAAGSATITTIASFDGSNGSAPAPRLTFDSAGNLWGTASGGGDNNFGTVFQIAAGSSTLTTVASFDGSNGSGPFGNLTFDSAGNLWGTAYRGGTSDNGTVYKIAAGGSTITAVASFIGSNGTAPFTGLTLDSAGNLWGATNSGGTYNFGTIFKIAAGSSTITSIASFDGSNGKYPNSGLTFDSAGNLWGAAAGGGTAGKGTVFRLSLPGTKPPAKLVFKQQPATTVAGHVIAPAVTVYVEDSSGKLSAFDHSAVTLSIGKGPQGAVFGGTLTVNAVNGIATFSDLSLTKAGSYTLLATDGALKTVTSKSFTISPDASTAHLVPTQQPADTIVGKALFPSLKVSVQDQYGNVITTDKSKITLSIINGPSGGTLGGTTTVTASKGIATFSKAFLKLAGNYTLSATDGTSPIATPLQFTQTITQGVTTVAAPKAAASYKVGKTINLSSTLKSTAPLSVPFAGTTTILDQNDAVLGTATVSASGKISFALTDVLAANYTCRVHYAGDDNHTAIDSPTFSLVVV